MTTCNVEIVQAFISKEGGGNPAGIVIEADSLSKHQRQKIAATVGLSETAFLSKSSHANYKVEFFTPTKQIPLCGHATVGAFGLLQQRGMLKGDNFKMETLAGIIPVYSDSGAMFMEQKAPVYTALTETEIELAVRAIRSTPAQLLKGFEPLIVDTGGPFLVIGVRDPIQLMKLVPDLKEIAEISSHFDLVGFYLFATQAQSKEHDATARMFAPNFGIKEESATGMAAGPLGCVLHDKLGIKKDRLVIEQGYLMKPPSPSHLEVRLQIANGSQSDTAVSSLRVGGRSAVVRTQQVEI